MSRESIKEAIEELKIFESLNRKGSPGAPYAETAASNKVLLDTHRAEIEEAVVDRIILLCTSPWLPECPYELIEGGFCDPVRVFVKDEPHSQKKISEGRYRLIFSVGLVDQCVERFFAQKQNKVEKSIWFRLPSLIGIGFDKMHVADLLNRGCWFTSHTVVESDVSGWDWSVQEGELRHACDLRISLIRDCPDNLARVMKGRYHCILHKLLSTSDGRTMVGPVGIMPSGSYLTSSDNSHMRATLGLQARHNLGVDIKSSKIKCVGDDCVEEDDVPLEELRTEYERLGHRIKDIRISKSDDFELCSHRFLQGTPIPLTLPKSVYKWAQGCRGLDETVALQGLCENVDARQRLAVADIISQYGGTVNNAQIKGQTAHPGQFHEGPEGASSSRRQ